MEEKKYKDILKGIVEIIRNAEHSDIGFASICTYIGDHCPELGESEDEQTRKQLLDLVHRYTLAPYSDRNRWVAYLEKLKDFDKQIKINHDKGYQDAMNEKAKFVDVILDFPTNFEREVSHFAASILNKEYDYTAAFIKVSAKGLLESAKLELEKQGKSLIMAKSPQLGEQKSIWHNEDEEPQIGSLILLIMQSGTPIVAKIIEPNHTFNHGERWAYIDDLLEKQAAIKDGNSIDPHFGKHIITDCGAKEKIQEKIIELSHKEDQVWIEEDEDLLKWSLYNLQEIQHRFGPDFGFVGKCIDWLKFIKDRVQPQPKWSEEDEKKRKLLISVLEVIHPNGLFKVNPTNTTDMEAISTEELVAWLKDRIQPQPKQVGWSEEDEENLRLVLECFTVGQLGVAYCKVREWLDSIKQRLS